jgi:hypothetical protein
MKYILIVIGLLQLNSLGLDLEFYLRVPIPTNVVLWPPVMLKPNIISRNDGAFIVENFSNPNIGIAVRPNKTYFFYKQKEEFSTNNYKVISQIIQGNIATEIQESTVSGISKIISSDTILKTLSNKGVIIESVTNSSTAIYRDRVVRIIEPPGHISGERVYSSTIKESALVIQKYDGNHNLIDTKSFNENIKASPYDINSIQSSQSFKIYAEFKPGYIYFYRLTDSDLLSSPNRITLGSSQNGSLTATVNNPEQALLNIQSSTNLIDWNTFKTIQNEPALEIIVPANKPKEFIRAIE